MLLSLTACSLISFILGFLFAFFAVSLEARLHMFLLLYGERNV